MAALGLRITDGTTTVTVSNGTTGWLTSYKQGSEDASEEFSTDKARVILLSSLSTIQATVASLNKLFRQADNYQKYGIGARVFIERDLGDAVWWRSEITKALPALVDQSLSFGLATGKMEMELVVTRRNFWEGTEAQIPLTNANGTNNTSGLTVYAIDDSQSGKDNWVTISSTAVEGDLPAPVKLEFRNTYNSANKLEYLIAANNWNSVDSGGTYATHIFEGESATGITALPATANYSLYSNGKYGQEATDTTPSNNIIYWSLSSDQQIRAAGNYFRIYAVLTATPTANNLWLQARLTDDGGGAYVFAATDWILASTDALTAAPLVVDLGVLRIGPNYLSGLTYSTLYLELGNKIDTGSATFDLDFVMAVPVDSWCKVDPIMADVAYDYKIVLDEINNKIYKQYQTSGVSQFGFVRYGNQLTVMPGVNQRMVLCGVGRSHAVRTATVRMWYRPRRLVI